MLQITEWKFAAAVIAVLIGGVTIAAFVGVGVNNNSKGTQDFMVEMDYNASTEQIRVTVVESERIVASSENGPYTKFIRICKEGGEESRHCGTPVRLRAGNMSVDTGYWVAADEPAASEYPLRNGDSVTIVGDGTDDDEDGTAGVENGRLRVWIQGSGAGGAIAAIEIRNSEIVSGSWHGRRDRDGSRISTR